ncbi:MAG TPA: CYTH domain-containing protein [Bacteroidia bacterium]|jgi:CYTH domain-containing protein
MPFEIERKFLVDREKWAGVKPHKSVSMKQGYLLSDGDKTLRVRVAGDQGFVTIKGRTKGLSRPEFEYEVPVNDAEELLKLFGGKLVEKVRHYVQHGKHLWEVDEFSGKNAGLLVAEVELDSEEEKFERPEWIDKEVTTDKRYSNASLAARPFSEW